MVSKSWYVVQTLPNSEVKAQAHLLRQGFEVYLPCYWKTRRHARKTEQVKRPLFPRYMFIAIDVLNQRWRAINSTVGVYGLIADGKGPVSIASEVIGGIQEREGEDGVIRVDEQTVPFKKGETVQINTGPFVGVTAIFSGLSGEERVRLLLDLMGRRTEVKMPLNSVTALA